MLLTKKIMSWRSLENGIWNEDWREDIDFAVEDPVNGLLFASSSHRCPFIGSWMYGMIVVDLEKQSYLTLGWVETKSIDYIFLDSDREHVYYFFYGGDVSVFSAKGDHQEVTQFNCGVYHIDSVAYEGSNLVIRGRTYEQAGVQSTYRLEDWNTVYESLESRLPCDLITKIVDELPTMYIKC